MKRQPRPSESQEQAAVVDWWAVACRGYGLPEFALFAIPNAAKRSYALAARMRKEGLRPGIPDLCLAVPVPEAHGLYIEMKRRPNRPSAEQEEVLLYLRQQGYHALVCWSADEAIRAITAYLTNAKRRV